MKRLLPLLLVVSSFLSCSDLSVGDELIIISNSSIETRSLDETSPCIAEKDHFLVSLDMVKSYVERYRSKDVVKGIIPIDRGYGVPFYIVNFENSWIIVSGDQRTYPILAEGIGNIISEEDMTSAQVSWIESELLFANNDERFDSMLFPNKVWAGIKQSLNYDRNLPSRSGEEGFWIKRFISSTTQTTEISRVNHLIETKWGQYAPWNQSVRPIMIGGSYTHYAVGCVPIAMAQILFYYHNEYGTPTGLYETIDHNGVSSISNYVKPSNRWSSMKLTASSAYGNSQYSSDLMASIGIAIGVNYGIEESSASCDTSTLAKCGIIALSNSIDADIIIGNLQNSKPVITTALNVAENRAHCWVIDGYVYNRTIIDETFEYNYVYSSEGYSNIVWVYDNDEMMAILPNVVNGQQVIERNTFNTKYALMNWGDDGIGDDNLYLMSPLGSWAFSPYNMGSVSLNDYRTMYYDIVVLDNEYDI